MTNAGIICISIDIITAALFSFGATEFLYANFVMLKEKVEIVSLTLATTKN